MSPDLSFKQIKLFLPRAAPEIHVFDDVFGATVNAFEKVHPRDFRSRSIEVFGFKKFPDQVAGRPVDHAGQAELIDEKSKQIGSDHGARLGDVHPDFHFVNSVFQVRSFVAGDGFGSHRNPATTAKGRPVAEPAAPQATAA
ncbi:MAG: hypothetical protein H0W39_01170 [Sphingomonas sp.]|nr:hypothetical protein [Sphingomonas sp.]